MDKSKRKSLIISYLKDSISIQDFNDEIGVDIEAMSDPLLVAIQSDLRDKGDASFFKGEILAFDKKQEESFESLGSDYIENEKRVLTLQACRYTSLLADPEIRTIMEKWGTTNEISLFQNSEEEYKNTSFTHLLQFLESHPEYNLEIQEILDEIASENALSEELQELSETINNNSEEKKVQNAKRSELVAFMDETLHAFDTLLQLDAIDEETNATIKNASMQSYRIYREKYSKLMAGLENNLSLPGLQEKLEQIESVIGQLEEKYGNFTQNMDGKEQERPQEESIKDEVGDENKTKTSEQRQEEEKKWRNRLEKQVGIAENIPEGPYTKQEIINSIKDVDEKNTQKNNQELTNPNNGREGV